MIYFDFEKKCYGCRNCENICPVKAITMIENKEGFLMPHVDENKCIKCGLCEKKCPYINCQKKQKVLDKAWYSCYDNDEEKRMHSTSGGIFPVLAQYVIENDGYVCGCVWDEKMKPVHVISNSLEYIEKMRGSKYMQSDLLDIARCVEEKLKGSTVLFSGTPCQVAAIKQYINNNENLITCSIICEGAGPYKVWEKYKEYLEKKYKTKMIKALFRKKEIGWDSPIAQYTFENGRVRKTLSYGYDLYVRGFLEGLFYRNSCNACQYKDDGHNSDIIIGDLWGANREEIKKSNNQGISLVIVNSHKGEKVFNEINKKMSTNIIEDKSFYASNNKMLMKPIEKNKNRDLFFNEIDSMDIKDNIYRNLNSNNIKAMVKEILYKTKIYTFIKK